MYEADSWSNLYPYMAMTPTCAIWPWYSSPVNNNNKTINLSTTNLQLLDSLLFCLLFK